MVRIAYQHSNYKCVHKLVNDIFRLVEYKNINGELVIIDTEEYLQNDIGLGIYLSTTPEYYLYDIPVDICERCNSLAYGTLEIYQDTYVNVDDADDDDLDNVDDADNVGDLDNTLQLIDRPYIRNDASYNTATIYCERCCRHPATVIAVFNDINRQVCGYCKKGDDKSKKMQQEKNRIKMILNTLKHNNKINLQMVDEYEHETKDLMELNAIGDTIKLYGIQQMQKFYEQADKYHNHFSTISK